MKRRHTSRIELNGLVLEAVNSLELEFLTLENVAEELKIDELKDDEVRASLVVAAERQAIPSCDILTVWNEFKHPRHEEVHWHGVSVLKSGVFPRCIRCRPLRPAVRSSGGNDRSAG